MGKTTTAATTAPVGRLAGKVALITGAAGNLGQNIARRYLAEGATVVFSGRDRARTDTAREAAVAAAEVDSDRASTVVIDGADAESVRAGIAEVVARHGRIDILVNNAGSAGPKQPLENLPLSTADLAALQAAGSTDSETVGDAARNIMVVAWNMVRAAAGAMGEGGSIINVSTIFSRTEYYARAAYTVPKAAMNALSRELATELGPRGIRVNLLFPGPIASERIRNVFAAMDGLRGDEAGATANHFFDLMALERSVDGAARAKTFPTPADIAHTCVFLGSDESAAFSGHDFEVTHGMAVRPESRSTFTSRPTMRSIDGGGLGVLVSAGSQLDDAIAIARVQADAGAEVLLGFHARAAAEDATAQLADTPRIHVVHFPRHDNLVMDRVLAEFTATCCPVTGAIILPTRAAGYFTGAIGDASDAQVERFVDDELEANIAVARTLSRYWKRHDGLLHDPRFVFVSNGDDGAGNAYANLLRAALEELIRVWRDESAVDAAHGRRDKPEWGNQIVRYTNAEPESLSFAAGQAARIVLKERKIDPVNLYLPESIAEATGARRAMVGTTENITGLHLGKVALITGGSAGIGGQVARLLALAGAKVMMVARRESELAAARERIVGELEDIGFSGVERRVRTLANVDVADMASLKHAVDETIKAFGHIDYLINNAGVSGAEEMAVDMDLKAWRNTQNANLISNYALMHMVVPMMKAQGSGYILNVSSYFGGEKFLAVSYPNRTDYAVSKAGQRAMVESMARHLGPEIQINAIAPGPVDGDRLAGLGGKPGLFERRGRLILENKRLNAVYAATIKAVRRGENVETILGRLARNDTVQLSHDKAVPQELRDLALACAREGDESCCWDRYLLTPALAAKLVKRLRLGGFFLGLGWASKPDDGWLLRFPPDDMPWLPAAQIGREAAKVRSGVLSQLHLGKMPTEGEVAQATVFFLADRAVSGETFMPSGGLNVERSTTERELFGSPRQERVDAMAGKTVWLVGEHLVDYLAESARSFLAAGVARVVLLPMTAAGGAALATAIDGGNRVETLVVGDAIEDSLDAALTQWGRPTTIVSTPFKPLPDALFDGPTPLDGAGFADVVETNLTHHFRVARKASLFDGCQIVLVSPDVPMGQGGGSAFALANFVKTTLHAFTATIAVENERLVHDVPVNQINLTRRVRSEEPRNAAEHDEEVKRFARAVLLAGTPLPDAEDSRYRARVYRGVSITV
ncbi:SDR family NAD(P)-dependent oxidoreductase [Polymorphobacter fuscus]|uniref:SDR family oxidoreductase n=1 Tax=Sandarakinorhabdus fusca TaxID=1439888 RepID=A0A7C9LF77_9SPHN|nr:SDR family NAD(P)-dependent oxidoreductase [Polymorphobacter fuscus]KAB7648918.1 SDR family oxidoreductase [Polymorphobacter fuscus]MQT16507.1 SDR family oxidoreductase [Polymorphobacter fuscus]NJC07203.1 malonyl-CoA reductase/3-hydroxypropionate dehydrogenase (NADP+) [Polymorphobacter fuscus]